MLKVRWLFFLLLLTATWEGMLYLTVSGINFRPYQPVLGALMLVILWAGRIRVDWMAIALLLYFLAGLPGLSNSISPGDTARTLFFTGLMVVIALTVRTLIRTREALSWALQAWALGVGTIVNVFGMFQLLSWFAGRPISPHFGPEFYPIYRPYSFFIEPNFYGNFLAAQIIILVILWLSPQQRRIHLLCLISLPPALLLLAFNQSRGPWIALGLALTIYVFFRYVRRGAFSTRLAVWGLGLLCVSVVGLSAVIQVAPDLSEPFVRRLRDTVQPLAEGAARDRVYDIQRSFEATRRRPWIGHGVGTWGYYVGLEGRSAQTPPRNIFVAWMFEKGLLGATAGVVLVFTIFVRHVRALRAANAELWPLIWAPFLGWLAIFFTFQFTVLEISPLYWITLGLFIAASDLALYPALAAAERLQPAMARSGLLTPNEAAATTPLREW
jgi:O-Antigen ligase